ncbi:hypothetical protein SARC_04457 [Sphaeroforma arctica JP610]|uniref:Uncharacterized protein n=1 Tax=Sphaeroforma arctica JP610 TaxID=667725 RepID=A0A0L0G380_9EUKA|nr:hypothetical protein SARC_04457 [Sphaeroforma arctica JP610]KNC83296.1 hypothetical protein SARC_04457 [Sphaeroforma arctica JP610]|eukprot:XP_014157198.1 hypothetical protein SARC_04457 [Sphaeroforma arctica JP610]
MTFLEKVHDIVWKVESVDEYVSGVFDLFTNTFTDDTRVYSIRNEKWIERAADEYFSTIRANIVDTIGSPAVLLTTRNKSTDDLRVKPPALRFVDKPQLADTPEGLENTATFLINYRSIDQTELRPRSFAAKVSQKFTEAFANDVYIYSIRDKETFKNGTLGYYNALKKYRYGYARTTGRVTGDSQQKRGF